MEIEDILDSGADLDLEFEETPLLSKHDAHNMEIKTSFLPNEVDQSVYFDLLLFVPRSLRLRKNEVDEVKNDFYVRHRLALAKTLSHDMLDLNSLISKVEKYYDFFSDFQLVVICCCPLLLFVSFRCHLL